MNLFLKITGLKEFYLYLKESIVYLLEKKKWNKLKKQRQIKLNLGSVKKGTNGFVNIVDGNSISLNANDKIILTAETAGTISALISEVFDLCLMRKYLL